MYVVTSSKCFWENFDKIKCNVPHCVATTKYTRRRHPCDYCLKSVSPQPWVWLPEMALKTDSLDWVFALVCLLCWRVFRVQSFWDLCTNYTVVLVVDVVGDGEVRWYPSVWIYSTSHLISLNLDYTEYHMTISTSSNNGRQFPCSIATECSGKALLDAMTICAFPS